MQLIKKIIKEELEKVLSVLNETDFYKSVDYEKIATKENPKDSIIYNYEKGRVFAGNNLEADIANLNQYHLVEYLPKSVSEEMWSFEYGTVYGTTLIVDIKRIVRNNKSYWSMNFGQLYKGEQVPTLMGELDFVEGYENFVATVNKKMSATIDPSKY
jgi:hypothetical protein